MKKILFALLAVVLVGFTMGCKTTNAVEDAANDYFVDYPTSKHMITWTDLFAKVDAGDAPFILSIRKDASYAAGHIEGAYHAAWGTDLADAVSLLPTDVPVYVYCYSGQTSNQTVAVLRLAGVDAISVLHGFVFGKVAADHADRVSTVATTLPDAGASFNSDLLEFAEGYFNAIPVDGKNIINSATARPLIEAGDLHVIDIRRADDFAKGHIAGAINIPFGAGMQEAFADLDMSKSYIVACYSGQTAGQTVAVLRALGYDAVSLLFGMNATRPGWVNTLKNDLAMDYFNDYPTTKHMIEWADLFAKVDAGDNPFILGIKRASDETNFVKDSYFAEWGTEDLANAIPLLPTDVTVYVYCVSGQTANQTVALLRMLGIDAVSVLHGFKFGNVTRDFPNQLADTALELPDANATFNPFMLSFVQAYFNAIPVDGSNLMNSATARPLIEAGDLHVIDIRRADDFAKGHIAGAINIPFGAGMQEAFADLDMSKSYIVACYSGQTAGQTVAVLRALGYDAVSLLFGMSATRPGWGYGNNPVVPS